MAKKVYRAGGFLMGKKFTIKDGFLSFKGAYGGYMQVPIKDIETVAIDKAGMGKCNLKIVGRGTELGKVKLPAGPAMKTQKWILNNLK